ncbi:MAG: SET domain-containing protein [Promethearchaeota archaeon]
MKSNKSSFNTKATNPIEEYTYVKPSKIDGLGLFAKKLIPKGTILWHARPQDVLIIKKDQFLTLDTSYKSPLIKDYIHDLLTYSYYESELDALIFCLDNAKFVNHSFNANSGISEDENGFCAIAKRDIQPGEEITEDYSKYKFCDWLLKYKQYFDPSSW